MDQELFARFQKCAVEVLSVSDDQVTPDAKFGDDLDAELFLERHDELDEVEAVGIEVLGEAGLPGHLGLVDREHLDRALLEGVELCIITHSFLQWITVLASTFTCHCLVDLNRCTR